MARYYRADGLKLDGNSVVAVKQTNLPFIGATWRPFEGIIWHLSEEAMHNRLHHRNCYELKVTQVEVEDFIPLFIKFHNVDLAFARHEREQ